jgi:hypothetical protein
MKARRFLLLAVALAAVLAAGLASASRVTASDDDAATAQVARLYQLQAAFHRAATVQPEEPQNLEQRIADMLSLWTDDGSLTTGPTTYRGKGSCEPGSATLCDFFTNVAGPFRPQNRWGSLSPSFKTSVDVQGNTAALYFECHYIGEDGQFKARLAVNATAVKVGSRWLLAHADVSPAGFAYP